MAEAADVAMIGCVFCEIVEGSAPAEVVFDWSNALAIVPLDPIVRGHILVLPKMHVTDFQEDPLVAGMVMQRVAELARILAYPASNVITSLGRPAAQSIFHLHYHLIPRATDDGLALPWYSGRGNHG